MDRLTWKTSAGTVNFKMDDKIRKDQIARSAFYQLAAERLAAYEDTGLEPDEIPHWIPVSERLPETGGIYLTYAPCTWPVQSANFTTICGKPQFSTMNHGGVLHGVTHWMPLPAAPKEKK